MPTLQPVPSLPELKPIGDQEAFRTDAKTEILDAAALRDQGVKQAIVESSTQPEAESSPEIPSRDVQPAETTNKNGKTDLEVAPATYTPPPQPTPDPARQWQEEVDRLLNLARQNAREGGGRAEVWAARERILTCLAGPEESSLWKTVVFALASPPSAPEEVEEAKPDATPLPACEVIADLQLCRRVLGFGKTEPLASDRLKPGQEVLLYAESEGLGTEPAQEGFRCRLGASLTILSADGRSVWSRDFEVEDHCRRRRRDFFVGYSFALPEGLPAGTYQVRLIQKDLVAGREASKTVDFTVIP